MNLRLWGLNVEILEVPFYDLHGWFRRTTTSEMLYFMELGIIEIRCAHQHNMVYCITKSHNPHYDVYGDPAFDTRRFWLTTDSWYAFIEACLNGGKLNPVTRYWKTEGF